MNHNFMIYFLDALYKVYSKGLDFQRGSRKTAEVLLKEVYENLGRLVNMRSKREDMLKLHRQMYQQSVNTFLFPYNFFYWHSKFKPESHKNESKYKQTKMFTLR